MVPITRSSSGITSNRPRVIVKKKRKKRKKKRQNPNYQPEVAQCLKESVHNAIISLRRACSASRRVEFFSETRYSKGSYSSRLCQHGTQGSSEGASEVFVPSGYLLCGRPCSSSLASVCHFAPYIPVRLESPTSDPAALERTFARSHTAANWRSFWRSF